MCNNIFAQCHLHQAIQIYFRQSIFISLNSFQNAENSTLCSFLYLERVCHKIHVYYVTNVNKGGSYLCHGLCRNSYAFSESHWEKR